MILNATTNPLIEPTQTTKVTDPTNPKAPFITETNKKNNMKENIPLGMAAVPLTPVNFGMITLKY